MNDSCIQILAWILLTIGTCILASVLYIALRQPRIAHTDADDDFDASLNLGHGLTENTVNNHKVGFFNLSINALSDVDAVADGAYSRRGCRESSCRIVCFDNDDLYADAAATMRASPCAAVTALVLAKQQRICGTDWINVNFQVLKIVLIKSQQLKLKSGAFNSPMFSKVFHMCWIKIQLSSVDNGALLGLYSLRKLEITAKLPNLSIALLQPVQTTLLHLRLNAGVTFYTSTSIFKSICLEKLQHLDLSYNTFIGPLTRSVFAATPNVAYLYLRYCSITAIDDNAFYDLRYKLKVLSLAHNLLKTIAGDVLSSFIGRVSVELEPNAWHCNCQLQSLVELYAEHSGQFISGLYCRLPHRLYGRYFDDLDALELECEQATSTTLTTPTRQSTLAATQASGKTTVTIWSDNFMQPTTMGNTEIALESETTSTAALQISCSAAIELSPGKSHTIDKRESESDGLQEHAKSSSSDSFVFQPPKYNLVLQLLANYSVRASIENYDKTDQLNIIWFSEYFDRDVPNNGTTTVRYNCKYYEDDYMITSELEPNSTYTFCMLPPKSVTVSPLHCQPLHVPLSGAADNGELTIDDDKQFTIGMLCTVFALASFFGAIVAYIGIKTYPDLLEGSKNVLVVKKSDKTCYVSTITESEYMKQSCRKRPLSFPSENHKPLPEIPATAKAASNDGAAESFRNTAFNEDEYEMPQPFMISYAISEPNKYGSSPTYPPPLPKRNSTLSLGFNKQAAAAASDSDCCIYGQAEHAD